MNNAYKSWGQRYEEFWGLGQGAWTFEQVKTIINQDPTDIRSTFCIHVKGAYCPDCNYPKKEVKNENK